MHLCKINHTCWYESRSHVRKHRDSIGWDATRWYQIFGIMYLQTSTCLEKNVMKKNVDMFECARMTEHPVISLGDLKFNYILDKTFSTNPIHYIETAYDMRQLIDQPTRVDDKTFSVLDVIRTSHPALHRGSAVLKYTLNDHYLIYTHTEFKKPNHQWLITTLWNFATWKISMWRVSSMI